MARNNELIRVAKIAADAWRNTDAYHQAAQIIDMLVEELESDTLTQPNEPLTLEDNLMSELVWDVFCVLHSFDWYKSGDTCEESYREDVKTFKTKWLRGIGGDKIKEMIDRELERARESLKKSLGGIRDE